MLYPRNEAGRCATEKENAAGQEPYNKKEQGIREEFHRRDPVGEPTCIGYVSLHATAMQDDPEEHDIPEVPHVHAHLDQHQGTDKKDKELGVGS